MRSLSDFDLTTAGLDSIESAGRDIYGVNLLEWAKFRHIIFVGNDDSKLRSTTENDVPKEVKLEYQALAKSHYQCASRLVSACQCMEVICKRSLPDQRAFVTYFKAQPEFYFHIGACLDGIARLAFLLCTHGQPSRMNTANWWDYSKLRKWNKERQEFVFRPEYEALGVLAGKYSMEEIYLIRNAVTHGWQLPGWTRDDGDYWPEEIKTQRFLAWPYIEREEFNKYTWKHTIQDVVVDHFRRTEGFFSEAFSYFSTRVHAWEERNQVSIGTS